MRRQKPQPLSGAGGRQRRGQRRQVNARDGVAIRDEAKLRITALEDSELVLVDAA